MLFKRKSVYLSGIFWNILFVYVWQRLMAKPFKGKKSPEQQGSQTNTPEKKVSLSGKFLDTLKDSLTDFAKLSETERSTLYGNQAFLDQFWEYFKKEQPDLLGGLKKEELPAYLTALEKK